MKSYHRFATAAAVLVSLSFAPGPARADPCSGDDFAKVVDGAGASLRQYNLDAAPKLQARLKVLATKKGWGEQEFEEQAITYLHDERIAKLDETANTLLAKIDTLGRQDPGQAADCAKLEELRTAGIELMAVMKTKTGYLMARVDAEVGAPGSIPAAAPSPSPGPATPTAPGEKSATAKDSQQATAAPAAPPVPPVAPARKPPANPPAPWSTTTATSPKPTPVPAPPAPPVDVAMVPPPPPPPAAANDGVPRPVAPMVRPDAILEPDEGYTIDEIRDATKGFFGSISTGLAAVIEHAFQSSGQPTGYVLGQEGGGAFLGGLRYGDGLLYIRRGGTQKIFWHGPSVGLDFGAAGARTMFLIYKMREPGDLYRVFTGIDGSAFVVGGVGLTLLGGGDMLLAPIRSGLGLRVGANIGYLRFTSTQTWNPF